jgi:gamma-glutamylcyclotransferase (GGCT)/AIG2-like uncharacterized protein YtfP
MKKVLVYGSLREGMYNFKRVLNFFGESSIKKIDSVTLKGFNIFDLGHYPGLNKSENEKDTVVFDLMEVSDKAFEFIERMELGAGYSKHYNEEHDAYYYVYDYKLDINSKVKSGDWVKHHSQLNSYNY